MASTRDYYAVLNVPRDASTDDLRAAHRKLARELHPDVNKSPDAAARFQEVQEAYDVLSDPEKRSKYDRMGHRAFVNGGGGFGGGGGGAGGGGQRRATYTWSNIADPFGAGARRAGAAGHDAEDIGSIFEEFFGADAAQPGARRAGPFSSRGRAKPMRGRDVQHEISVPFDLACKGGQHALRISRTGKSEDIDVRIPRAVEDGAKLRLKGKGEPGRPGAEAGDLILTVRIAAHPRYRRDGLDILADLPISIVEATLGAKVPVETPGGNVEVGVPPGAASGSKLRLRKRGLETDDGRFGDFYAVVKIVPPKELSDEDRELLRALGERLPPVR
ncbi:MAG: J domain-containing protein [Phycisphaerales bacterium]|nr:MAG: J domain-containing protein [Phycisphaerales bacterium]